MSRLYAVTEAIRGDAFGGKTHYFDAFDKALKFQLGTPPVTGGADGWVIFYDPAGSAEGFPRSRMRMLDVTTATMSQAAFNKHFSRYRREIVGDSLWVAAPQGIIQQVLDLAGGRHEAPKGKKTMPTFKVITAPALTPGSVQAAGRDKRAINVSYGSISFTTTPFDSYRVKSEMEEAKNAIKGAIAKEYDEEAISCVSKMSGDGRIHVEVEADGSVFSAGTYDRSHPYAEKHALDALLTLRKLILAVRQQTSMPTQKYTRV